MRTRKERRKMVFFLSPSVIVAVEANRERERDWIELNLVEVLS